MLTTIFLLWLLAALILAIFNLKASLGLMLAYLLLVPYSTFTFSSITIEYNYVIAAIFLIFLIRIAFLNRENFDSTLIKPFTIFVIVIFLSSFISTNLDLNFQLSSLRTFVLRNFLFPIMLWQIIKQKSDVDYFIKIILVCFSIMGLYGIYCLISGQNPYIDLLSSLFNKQNNNDVFAEIERGGITGKIQSLTSHPMQWSLLLCLGLFSSYIFFNLEKKALFYIFSILLFFNLMVCNVRSGIIAFALGFAYFFTHFSVRLKMISISVIILILLISIDTSIFGKYQAFADSIIYFTDSDKDISGSSIDMRLAQLGGAVEIWQDGGMFFGNGFGWCGNYRAAYGDHPILLSFESIVYIIIIENGLIGILLYLFLFYQFFRINYLNFHKTQNDDKTEYWLVNSFLISYIVFVIVTGLFGFNYFLIFFAILLLSVQLRNKNEELYVS